jgi:hypothetical protein
MAAPLMLREGMRISTRLSTTLTAAPTPRLISGTNCARACSILHVCSIVQEQHAVRVCGQLAAHGISAGEIFSEA